MAAGDGWHRSNIVTRWEELQADFAQERELARLEAAAGYGHRRAAARLAARLKAEKDWYQFTATRWRAPSEARFGDDDR